MSVKEKITVLINAIQGSQEPYKDHDLEAVEGLITDCGNYIDRVMAMEAAIASARFRLEPQDFQELVTRLDRGRKYAHDSLIASIRLVNRLCGVYGVDIVYTGPDERIPMADFAMEVVKEYFEGKTIRINLY